MSDTRVYLAFPDGVLNYECSSCDQRCCKTGGLAVLPQEREQLVRSHPALDLVAPPPGPGIEIIATPISACWFLEDCRCTLLQRGADRHNRKHTPPRPSICTLFPFNLFATLGETLVVAPNSLCPLTTRGRGGVTHAEILELVRQVGPVGQGSAVRTLDGERLVLLENVLCAAAGAMLDEMTPLPFLAFTALATEAHMSGGDAALMALQVDHLDLESSVDRLEQMAEIVGIPVPTTDAFTQITPLVTAWSPSLRLFALEGVPLHRLPEAQLALSLYAAHWQSLRPSRPFLPQALAQMASALSQTLTLLATWDDPWPAADAGCLIFGEPPSETVTLRDLGEPGVERAQRLRVLATARALLRGDPAP